VELASDCEQSLHFTIFALQLGISLLYTCLYLLFLDTSGIFDVHNAVYPLNPVFIACFKTFPGTSNLCIRVVRSLST
jgi:hypothetical protein